MPYSMPCLRCASAPRRLASYSIYSRAHGNAPHWNATTPSCTAKASPPITRLYSSASEMPNTVDKGVTLYTSGTPNGWKLSILLKELNYPHEIRPISLSKNEQKEDWYLKINPNGRIPAIVDHDNDDYPVFESGAIMMYIAEKAGKLYPQDWNQRHEVNQWLFFLNAGVGPMQGQANHFVRYAPEKIPYGQNRYINETKRLYTVLDNQLKKHEWLAAGQYTIAGVDLTEFKHLNKWVQKIHDRPAVIDGLNVPEENKLLKALDDPEQMKKMIEDAQGMMVSTDKH